MKGGGKRGFPQKVWPFKELEFVIDEQPVAVAQTFVQAAREEKPVDFLAQIGALLEEKERLAVMVRLLERHRSGADETEKLVRRLLPVLDGFERILEAARDFPAYHQIANWLKSVEGVYFRLKDVLEKMGLAAIEPVGQPVNLDLHEVVECRRSPDHEPGTIIAVRQRGYVFRGRLLRDAQVVVASDDERS